MAKQYAPSRIPMPLYKALTTLGIAKRRTIQSLVDEAIEELLARNPVNMRKTFNAEISGITSTNTNRK